MNKAGCGGGRKDYLRLLFFGGIFYFAFILAACYHSQPSSSPQQPAPDDSSVSETYSEAFPIPAPNINLAQPLQVSNRAEDVSQCAKINQLIDQSEYANSRWGVLVLSLRDGRITCAREARKLFNPASIQKTITSIVALDLLSADFRWKTSVFAQNQIGADGTLNGNLTIYGQGAPDFDTEALENLVSQLQARGLKHITGNIVGDDSYFKGDAIGDGWTWNELQWHYGAEASALSFKENVASVYMQDGKAIPSTDFLQVENRLKPIENGAPEGYGIKRGLEDDRVYIWGNGDKAYGKLSVHNPALWTAKVFKESLAKKGIIVDGEAQSADWKSENKLDSASASELAFVESKTMAEIVRRMNKNSVNLYGELILRTLGKKFGDTAPDDNKQLQPVRGDDSAGASVIKKWLREKNVAVDEIEVHDGSGLSRLDFITPEAFGRALVFAAQSKFAEVFENSLPVAGTDGTLGGRLGKVKGKILAKTGSITFVNSLTGYAQGVEGENLAFVIIGNNVTRKSDSSRIVDAVAASLVKDDSKPDAGANTTNKTNANSNQTFMQPPR